MMGSNHNGIRCIKWHRLTVPIVWIVKTVLITDELNPPSPWRRGVPKTCRLQVDFGSNPLFFVIPAEAGIQERIWKKNPLDTRFRGYDRMVAFVSVFGSCSLCSHFAYFRFAWGRGVSTIPDGDTKRSQRPKRSKHYFDWTPFPGGGDGSCIFNTSAPGGMVKLKKELERPTFVLISIKRVRVTFPNPSKTSAWMT